MSAYTRQSGGLLTVSAYTRQSGGLLTVEDRTGNAVTTLTEILHIDDVQINLFD